MNREKSSLPVIKRLLDRISYFIYVSIFCRKQNENDIIQDIYEHIVIVRHRPVYKWCFISYNIHKCINIFAILFGGKARERY